MNKKFVKRLKLFTNLFERNHILKESAALTFTTILEIIPFIIFILFIIPEIPFLNYTDKLKEILINILMPKSIDKMIYYIDSFLARKNSYNIINFIIVMITSYSLFTVITNTFDNILNVHKKLRLSFVDQVIKFFGTLIFGLVFIALIIASISTAYISFLNKYPIIDLLSRYLIPFLTLFIALLLTYAFIPTVNLRATSILYTSIITSVIWVLIKSLFNFYVEYLTNIELIYGVLASIPVFIIWIYINWIIILSGVIVVSILENRYEIPKKNLCGNRLRIIIEKEIDDKNRTIFNEDIEVNDIFEKILRLLNEK